VRQGIVVLTLSGRMKLEEVAELKGSLMRTTEPSSGVRPRVVDRDWAEYYDGLTARRTALASYFAEWIEL
jgi:hypothetical protein